MSVLGPLLYVVSAYVRKGMGPASPKVSVDHALTGHTFTTTLPWRWNNA